MGVPTAEVGYTPAMPRREDHEVAMDTKKNTTNNLKLIKAHEDFILN